MELIDNKIPFVYISGWKGNGKESGSYKWLERHFKNIDCYAAGGQTNVEMMIRDLEEILHDNYCKSGVSPIIIGNSFGGFLANLFRGIKVLINPALFPSETLPHITDLTDEEIENFRYWQPVCSCAKNDVYAICSENDELIPDHRPDIVSSNPPIMIPGGKHRLTDEQRDQYLLPLLMRLLEPNYRIVKLSCDTMEDLLAGKQCKGVYRRFPKVFVSQQDAEKHLKCHIQHHSNNGRKTVIGYMIQEIYGDNPHRVYRQWSYTPDGKSLVDAFLNCSMVFDGRDPQTLPFRCDDYVIAYYCGDLILGTICAEPPTPTEVDDMKHVARIEALCDEVSFDFQLDSSDDCYLVDFTEEYHGHPSVTQVFPLPLDASEIPEEVKTALHWADNAKN